MIFHMDKQNASAVSLLLLGSCLLWASWSVIGAMADRWSTDSRYAHGYFVPMFALALLRIRRPVLDGVKLNPSAQGLAFVGLGAATQLVGGYYRVGWIEGVALLPYLCGLSLLLGGWRYLQWAWPSIGFLAFMVPLPWRVETALDPPLQSIATAASTYVLQSLGIIAFAEGNVIHLSEARIGVEDACSGLSMLMTFIALSTAAALIVRRPLFDRLVLVASSIPVALLANIARIVMTGTLHQMVGGHAATKFYHDLSGWVMMPLAMVLYWIEIEILCRVLIETKHEAPPLLDLSRSRRPPDTTSIATQNYKASVL
jgi:exosortase